MTKKLSVEQRGTPPYTVWNQASEEIRAQPASGKTFREALEQIFSLTGGGQNTKGYKMTRPARIDDASGKTVFSAGSESDVQLLGLMDEVGLNCIEIIENLSSSG